MAVVCIGSVRGAPGASTLAVLAAACWPRPVALIEADPAGGALAVRYRLGRTPGLAGLAALVRHGADEDALWQHAQMLPGELPVVVAPESGEVTAGILRDCAPALAAWCAGLEEVDIIIDCGRIAFRDVNWPLCAGADETIVVARPRAEELYPAAHRLRAMADDVPSAGLVLIGDRPHSPAEITSQLGVQVRGVVADDSWAAGVLTVGGRSRGLRRSSLVRSVRSFVDDLMYRLDTPVLEPGPRPAAALSAAGTPPPPWATPTAAALPPGQPAGIPEPPGRHPSGPTPAVVTSGSTPIVLPPAPPPPPSRVTTAAPAPVPRRPVDAVPPPPPPPAPVRSASSGLPPSVQRSRAAAAAAATATVTGPNRRVPISGQQPAVGPYPPYGAQRQPPPPSRPRPAPGRPGGQAVAPGRAGSGAPPGRQRPMRPNEPSPRRWRRDR